MKTIYLHIGSPKTGTTSIQEFLANNYCQLIERRRGILFPKSGRNVIAHHPLVADLRHEFNGDTVPAHCYGDNTRGANWEDLVDELNNHDEGVQKIILSSEDFFILFRTGNIAPIRRIREVLSSFEIVVIVYLRRQDEFVNSLYNQQVKGTLNSAGTSTKLLNQHPTTRKNYQQILTAWSDVFGIENVIVRPFNKNKFYDGNLISDFFNLIGERDILDSDIRVQKNKKLSIQEFIFKKYLNAQFDDNVECISFFYKIKSIMPDISNSSEFFLLKSDYEHIVNEAIAVNKDLDRIYNKGKKLFSPFPPLNEVSFADCSYVNMSDFVSITCGNVDKLDLSEVEWNKVKAVLEKINNEHQVDSKSQKLFQLKFDMYNSSKYV